MISKLNTAALSEYCTAFTEAICESFFRKNQFILGSQILTVTPIAQVNLFLLFELYERWKHETELFRSCYFNFRNEEMKEALNNLMNCASQHIEVKQADFEPLLYGATNQSLKLLLHPQQYFSEVYLNLPNLMVSQEVIALQKKYIRFHQFIPEKIGELMDDNQFVYANQATNWVEEIVTQNPDALDCSSRWVSIFSEVYPLNENLIVKKIIPNISFFDNATDKIDTLMAKYREHFLPEAPIIVENKMIETLTITNESPQFEPLTVLPVQFVESLPVTPEIIPQTVENQSDRNQKTPHKPPITTLVQGIPMYQKFLFIQELFGGSSAQFEKALEELDSFLDYDKANDLLAQQYALTYHWDLSNKTVKEFLDLVKRRFQH